MVEFGWDKFYSRCYVRAADIIHKHSNRVDGNAPNISDDDALAKVDGRYPNSATTSENALLGIIRNLLRNWMVVKTD